MIFSFSRVNLVTDVAISPRELSCTQGTTVKDEILGLFEQIVFLAVDHSTPPPLFLRFLHDSIILQENTMVTMNSNATIYLSLNRRVYFLNHMKKFISFFITESIIKNELILVL